MILRLWLSRHSDLCLWRTSAYDSFFERGQILKDLSVPALGLWSMSTCLKHWFSGYDSLETRTLGCDGPRPTTPSLSKAFFWRIYQCWRWACDRWALVLNTDFPSLTLSTLGLLVVEDLGLRLLLWTWTDFEGSLSAGGELAIDEHLSWTASLASLSEDGFWRRKKCKNDIFQQTRPFWKQLNSFQKFKLLKKDSCLEKVTFYFFTRFAQCKITKSGNYSSQQAAVLSAQLPFLSA